MDCVGSMPQPPTSCLDPFGGSGTTALTCQFLGVRPTTIEVNPFLADVIAAKLNNYNLVRLKRDYLDVLAASRRPGVVPSLRPPDRPDTLVEPGRDSRWVYGHSAAESIFAISNAINNLSTRKHRELLRVVLGSVLVPVSNVIVNGKGRRYRDGWKLRQKTGRDVDWAFREAFGHVYTDLSRFEGRPRTDFSLLRGDSRELIDKSDPADLAIFSPPYPNSFDYTDIYNLELWMLGYLHSWDCNAELRNRTLRSHVQLKRDFSTDELPSPELKRAYDRLSSLRTELWNGNIPEMVTAYFADMRNILERLKKKLTRRGRAFLAVGNSKYAGVVIDTATILAELAPSAGFKILRIEPIRSMRSSAQQGGRAELNESLVVLG